MQSLYFRCIPISNWWMRSQHFTTIYTPHILTLCLTYQSLSYVCYRCSNKITCQRSVSFQNLGIEFDLTFRGKHRQVPPGSGWFFGGTSTHLDPTWKPPTNKNIQKRHLNGKSIWEIHLNSKTAGFLRDASIKMFHGFNMFWSHSEAGDRNKSFQIISSFPSGSVPKSAVHRSAMWLGKTQLQCLCSSFWGSTYTTQTALSATKSMKMGVPSGKSTFSHTKNDVEIHHFLPRTWKMRCSLEWSSPRDGGKVGSFFGFDPSPVLKKKKLELDSQLDRKVLKVWKMFPLRSGPATLLAIHRLPCAMMPGYAATCCEYAHSMPWYALGIQYVHHGGTSIPMKKIWKMDSPMQRNRIRVFTTAQPSRTPKLRDL